MYKQGPINARMTGIFQHQCKGGQVVPKQVWADPFQIAWHRVLGQRGVALIDLQNTSRPIYSQSIVQLGCSDSSLSGLRAPGTNGCRDCGSLRGSDMYPTAN